MPKVIDYSAVLDQLTREGFKSLYYNSGAFGFAAGVETQSRGWIGEPDASIREAARPLIRYVREPVVHQLADQLIDAWRDCLVGNLWAMPKSHWAFELEFGSREWMPAALEQLGIDWRPLAPLNVAPAIEFELSDAELLRGFLVSLLSQLAQSDFQLVFPGRRTVCTVHSRKQLWWTSADPVVILGLDRALPLDSEHTHG